MSGGPRSTSEVLQKQHYDAIAEEYERHYSDKHSVAYRREFLYDPMFEGVDLAGANVLEAMCGDGSATDYLVEHGAKVTGLDISGAVIDSFRRKHPECHAIQASVLETGLADNSFDGVVIIG